MRIWKLVNLPFKTKHKKKKPTKLLWNAFNVSLLCLYCIIANISFRRSHSSVCLNQQCQLCHVKLWAAGTDACASAGSPGSSYQPPVQKNCSGVILVLYPFLPPSISPFYQFHLELRIPFLLLLQMNMGLKVIWRVFLDGLKEESWINKSFIWKQSNII